MQPKRHKDIHNSLGQLLWIKQCLMVRKKKFHFAVTYNSSKCLPYDVNFQQERVCL